jgi:enterochelin esterase-like enzyme
MLAFGSKDRLVAGQRLLAALLPPRDVLEVPGGHEWTTWRALWRQLWSSKLRQ